MKKEQRFETRIPWWKPSVPYITLAISLLVVCFATFFIDKQAEEQDYSRFNQASIQVEEDIENRLETYIALLRGGNGFFAATDSVNRAQFKAYVDQLHLQERYPGIQGIGFTVRFGPDEIDDLVMRMQNEGVYNFAIRPTYERPEYHAIIWLEPLDRRNRAAIGYDMYSEPVRRKAMSHARDTGKPALSGKVTLVQEIDEKKQAGFLIYVPLYEGMQLPDTVAERRQKLIGFVYSPFRADDFLTGIFGTQNRPSLVDFKLYDGGEIKEQSLLHNSRAVEEKHYSSSYKPRFTNTRTFEVAGHRWTLAIASSPELDHTSKQGLVPWIFLSGIVFSFILFWLSRSQTQALLFAQNAAVTLKQSEKALQDSNENLRFLTEASNTLSSSLDYQTTLHQVARLAVPRIADWCIIDRYEDGKFRHVAVAHKDPKKVKWAREMRKKYPPDPNAPYGLYKVVRTGKSEFYPHISDEMLVKVAKDKEHLKLLRNVGFTSAMIAPIFVGKKCIGTTTFVSAKTERVYTQEDLVMAEELAQRAGVAIENALLYEEARRAIAVRDDFISIASHELKTPLTSLKIFLQVIQKQLARKGEEAMAKNLGKIDQEVNKLNLLVGDLLNISRLQHGRLEFTMEKIDLDALVRETVKVIQPTTKKHAIHIEGKIGQMITGDIERIKQVIINLLTNAIKYSPQADKILVKLTPQKDAAMVSIRDFGIGIDKEHQSKIFNLFYRAEGKQERTYPGMGIGLYISREIIKRHGGIMTVESEKGKGSEFSFTLPYNLKTRQDKTRQDKTRQDKTRQDKTRQDKRGEGLF